MGGYPKVAALFFFDVQPVRFENTDRFDSEINLVTSYEKDQINK